MGFLNKVTTTNRSILSLHPTGAAGSPEVTHTESASVLYSMLV